MSGDRSAQLETQIRQAIDDGDVQRARDLLRVALQYPTAETYYLASQVALNEQQRQEFLEKARSFEQKPRAFETAASQPGARKTRRKRSTSTGLATRLRAFRQRNSRWIGLAALAVLGAILGAGLVWTVQEDELQGVLLAAAALAVIGLVVLHARSQDRRAAILYQVDVLALSLGALLATALAQASYGESLLQDGIILLPVLFWFSAAIAGPTFLGWKLRD